MKKTCAQLGMLLFGLNAFAVSIEGQPKEDLLNCIEKIGNIGKSGKQCFVQGSKSQSEDSEWTSIPPSDAQCTPGAKREDHEARVRISKFKNNAQFRIEKVSPPNASAVRDARNKYPEAIYIGNGPIHMQETDLPNGYVKSGGKMVNPIDCVKFRTNSQNLGKENGIFVRYRPRIKVQNKTSGEWEYQTATSGEWKYRVVSTDFLCAQLQPKAYVDWRKSRLSAGEDVERVLKDEKKWETDQEDLVTADQIDFAIQSGPTVLRGENNLLKDYNGASQFRSYIGVNTKGEPVVVEADGKIGSYCLGEYLRKQGIRDLLHRDSNISDASYREENGRIGGYPTQNPNANAASVLVIN